MNGKMKTWVEPCDIGKLDQSTVLVAAVKRRHALVFRFEVVKGETNLLEVVVAMCALFSASRTLSTAGTTSRDKSAHDADHDQQFNSS